MGYRNVPVRRPLVSHRRPLFITCTTSITGSTMRRIDIVFPVLPPAFDGIGDHTAHLAEALDEHGLVRILTAQAKTNPLSGVEVVQAFSTDRRRGVQALYDAVRADPPDWLLVQFNQFSYGRWGLNPYLPLTMRRIARSVPETRLAVLFHEDFVPVTSWKNALMTTWQRAQFWALGRTADLVLFSIAPWVDEYRSWFPQAAVRHLPVGSNIPRAGAVRAEVRQRLGFAPETVVVGYFGTIHGSRHVHLLQETAQALRRHVPDARMLYVGKDGPALARLLDERIPFHDAGPLPADAVSAHLTAMDVHLAPIVDGVSTRRGAFMAGLQHGVATVATRGKQTDALLWQANGEAFLLADTDPPEPFAEHVVALARDPTRRARLAEHGRRLYDTHFDWPLLADRLAGYLRAVDAPAARPEPA